MASPLRRFRSFRHEARSFLRIKQGERWSLATLVTMSVVTTAGAAVLMLYLGFAESLDELLADLSSGLVTIALAVSFNLVAHYVRLEVLPKLSLSSIKYVYPPDIQEKYGDEIILVMQEDCLAALEKGGRITYYRTWTKSFMALLYDAARERLSRLAPFIFAVHRRS